MDKVIRFLLLVALMLYIVSPIDLFPGPIDDIMLSVFYLMTGKNNKRIK